MSKAIFACCLFSITAIAGLIVTGHNSASILLAYYYAILTLNTFLSIKVLGIITPKKTLHDWVDIVFGLIYIALGWSFGSVTLFCAVSLTLFLSSILKYAHLLQISSYKKFISSKIKINGLAALLSAVTLLIALVGHPMVAAWMLLMCFAVANIYFLGINPMYRIDS